MLALAALYKFRNQRPATRFIVAALSSLRVSVQKGIELQQVLQHIVAGMLIFSFKVSFGILITFGISLTTKKIHRFSRSSSVWLLYLSGTKGIISRFYWRGLSEDEDQALLFQWVFYYDTLARLGIKHWRGP